MRRSGWVGASRVKCGNQAVDGAGALEAAGRWVDGGGGEGARWERGFEERAGGRRDRAAELLLRGSVPARRHPPTHPFAGVLVSNLGGPAGKCQLRDPENGSLLKLFRSNRNPSPPLLQTASYNLRLIVVL